MYKVFLSLIKVVIGKIPEYQCLLTTPILDQFLKEKGVYLIVYNHNFYISLSLTFQLIFYLELEDTVLVRKSSCSKGELESASIILITLNFSFFQFTLNKH